MYIIEFTDDKIDDWLDFFDKRAFVDNTDWQSCYCTYYYKPKYDEYPKRIKGNREYAIWLINEQKMKGYLIYDNDDVIGWCCTNEKNEYSRLVRNIGKSTKKTLAVVCFIIEKQFRNKGIATSILNKIVEDAKKKDYEIIEVYPNKKAKNEYTKCHGSYSMYKKSGFDEKIENGKLTMRLYLK